MKEINIFCFGFGQVAINFIKKINNKNIKINLSTTSRKNSKKLKLENVNYESFQFNEKTYDKSLVKRLENSDYILISIAPVNGEDIVVKYFSKIIESSSAKWITYLSATSVYGDHKGKWVSEDSDTNPTSPNGICRLNAENSWLSLARKKKLPVQIFRLSGIYSNQKNILARLKSGTIKMVKKKNHFFSRVHVDDISNILYKSLKIFKPNEIYNITDDKPASSEEVTLYGSKLLDIELPPVIEVNNLENEMLKNFYKDSKKVSNKKMKHMFNYELKYPSYVEGLNSIANNLT
jgi:nucleoside-diphosphate-sugar epimerase